MPLGFNIDTALSNARHSGTAGSCFPEILLRPGIICKNCSPKSFPRPSNLHQEGPSTGSSSPSLEAGVIPPRSPQERCCMSKDLQWLEAAEG